jgi:hypothetical protein
MIGSRVLDARRLPGKLHCQMRVVRPLAWFLLVHSLAMAQGLAWDIPQRGAVTYQRKTETWQVSGPPSRMRVDWVVADADHGGAEWRYLACAQGKQPAGFEAPGFDDSAWPIGTSEFGDQVGTLGRERTAWKTNLLCIRRKVDFAQRKPRAILLRIDHDDGIKVWCNGTLVLENAGYGRGHNYILQGQQLAAFTPGENTIAVQCSQVGGAQYLDVAIGCIPTLPPGVKSPEDIQKVLNENREAGAQVYRDLFGSYRPPAMLLAGELDSAQQKIVPTPGDLREIPWLAAMDLQRGTLGGTLNLDAYRLYRLGDIHLRGKVTATDATGWQTMEFALKSDAELNPLGESDRFIKMHVQREVIYALDGKLKIRRRLEIKDGKARMVECRTEMTGRIFRGKDFKELAAELEQVETWQIATTHRNQDTAFKTRVSEALKKGTAKLRAQLADTNSDYWQLKPEPDGADRTYHTGRLAIGLLALIKGGVPKNDEVLQRCLAELRKRKLVDTYTLGNALMAMEAYYAPDDEFRHLQEGAIDRPSKRKLPQADLELMQKWTDQLLNNIDTRVDTDTLFRFGYVRGEWFDHSVNQYGLLGLYSAHLCGIAVKPEIWEAAINHLISAQVEGTGKHDLDLVDYRTMARMQSDSETKRTVSRLITKAAGWNYQTPKTNGEPSPTWGSMTCAGITGLAICQAALLDLAGNKRAKLQGDATAARNAGFAWLAEHMNVRCHPGLLVRQQHWFYYYLYGLERAALLSGIALIEDRDWYFEGGMVLTGVQLPDGGWPAEMHYDQDIERNAMAILFLKQSTMPVLTGR